MDVLMSSEDIAAMVTTLRKRAADDRKIQANNEVIAAALMGQRILFDQGFRSDANTYAVRVGLDHANCAKNDAKLAADWDSAADMLEALQVHRCRIIHENENLLNAYIALQAQLTALEKS